MSWRLNKDCNILTPSSSGYSSTSFSSCKAAQPGALGTKLSAGSGSHCYELQQLTPNSELLLTRTSCNTRLYNCLTPTCYSERRICTQFNPSTVKVIPWYLRPDSPVIYTGAFLIWRPGRRSICYKISTGHCLNECRYRQWSWNPVFNPRSSHTKDSTSVSRHFKVSIKGKVEQFKGGVAPSQIPWCCSYQKGSFRLTLD